MNSTQGWTPKRIRNNTAYPATIILTELVEPNTFELAALGLFEMPDGYQGEMAVALNNTGQQTIKVSLVRVGMSDELEIVPTVFEGTDVHFILGENVLCAAPPQGSRRHPRARNVQALPDHHGQAADLGVSALERPAAYRAAGP